MKKYDPYIQDPVEYFGEAVEYINSTIESLQAIQATMRTFQHYLVDDARYEDFISTRHHEDIAAVTNPEGEYLTDQWQDELREAVRMDTGVEMEWSVDDIPW